MPRRPTRNITEITGTGQVNPSQVWCVFNCSRPGCGAIITVGEDAVAAQSLTTEVPCPECQHPNPIAAQKKGSRWKYCRVCEQLQSLENFHHHARFRAGRQLECKSCKQLINATLNPLRTTDQHREASQRRRLYDTISGDAKINQTAVYNRFDGRCFNCDTSLAQSEVRLDHTLPALYLWPLSAGPTLLCAACNGAKAEKWPSAFYVELDSRPHRAELQRLSYLTGIEYSVLAGDPLINPEALNRILQDADGFLIRWVRYPDEIKRLRNHINTVSGIDIFQYATKLPAFLLDPPEPSGAS